MSTRRTTLKSRSGTKLYAVRDQDGKFKDIQTYKRAHAADLRHKSRAEEDAAQEKGARGAIGKKVRKTATNAIRSVKSSVKGAVAAVRMAAKRAVKRVSGSQPPAVATARDAAGKTARSPATGTTKKPGKKVAKKAAKRAARKTTS